MNHYAELKVFNFLQKALKGEAKITEEVANQVASDVKAALEKQFNSGPRDEFKLRMSNIGKPKCQLWFEKNDPEDKTPPPPHFLMNMILGDLVEAVFKGLLRAADVEFKDNDNVTLKLPDGQEIHGEYDMEMDGKIDDVKSASDWSYRIKFEDFSAVQKLDHFGYISQLVGYSKAAEKEVGGWWVVNKGNGQFKYVSASEVDSERVLQDIQETVNYIEKDEPFERCFEAVPETYRNKASGNLVLQNVCKWCSFKDKCWPNLKTLPSRVSKAKVLPEVDYVHIGDGLAT